jgi:hypothetical protein
LRKAGYAAPTGGSLAGDSEWIAKVRKRAAELVPSLPEGGGRGDVTSADDVLVPWTGELGGHRYAVVAYPGPPVSNGGTAKPIATFAAAVLVGEQAEKMTVKGATPWAEPPYQTTSGQVVWVPTEDPKTQGGRALVFVLGPTVTGAKVATSREFFTKGTSPRTEWRPLRRDGGVWLGTLNLAELYLSDVRLEGPSDSTSNGPLEPQPQERFRAIAPAGTDLGLLDCASQVSSDLGGSMVDEPMLAATTRIAGQTLATAVLRAPGGPWLVSFCMAGSQPARTVRGAVYPAPADPGKFLAAIEAPDDSGPGGYLVTAPAGATTVQIGTAKVKVTNRLAYFPHTADRTGPQTVRALDATGKVIASTRSVVGDQ